MFFRRAARCRAPATDPVVVRNAPGFQDAIAAVADSALLSVVHIDVTGTALRATSSYGTLGMSPGSSPGISKAPMRALGSGILLSSGGRIITNDHVVENADSITVWVVAIGSPRGLDWTVTAGIVSATHRASVSTQAPEGLEDFIQTDTAINPGNSGGPLLNLAGEVIGMNAMIVSQSQGSEGLGFAIPSNLVKTVAQTLIRDGKVTRGDLGIATQDLTDPIRRSLKLSADVRGIVVTEALPLGPAAEASMTAGDVITTFQQTPAQSSAQFNRLVAAALPGTRVTPGVIRVGASQAVTLTVADQLALQARQAARPGYALLGIRVEPVTADPPTSPGTPGSTRRPVSWS